MTIFIDTNGEMDFADNERLRFVMHFLKLGSDPDVLEIKNDRFVREDAETSFQEIWLPCATAKQKEIDDLKAELEKAKAQAVPEGYVLVSKGKLHEWHCMANRSEELGCPECYESRGYAHNLAVELQEASESGAEG